jgi:hypothetical protein
MRPASLAAARKIPAVLRLSEEITADLKAYAKEEGIKHKGEATRRVIEEALQRRKAP